MNDIDRSVESMDFAIRRRFAWREVSAEQSAENMGLSDEEKAILTDATKICVMKGESVELVRGESFNIKITYPYDILIAEAILSATSE